MKDLGTGIRSEYLAEALANVFHNGDESGPLNQLTVDRSCSRLCDVTDVVITIIRWALVIGEATGDLLKNKNNTNKA